MKHNYHTKTEFKKGHQKGFQKGRVPWNKGKKLSKKTRTKMSDKKKGIRPKNIPAPRKGKDSNLWKGGVTPINRYLRTTTEYKLWRKAVFARDNYQCIWGGKEHGNKIEADHILPFADYPELRFAIDNGRTLCVDCHKKTKTYGRKTCQ